MLACCSIGLTKASTRDICMYNILAPLGHHKQRVHAVGLTVANLKKGVESSLLSFDQLIAFTTAVMTAPETPPAGAGPAASAAASSGSAATAGPSSPASDAQPAAAAHAAPQGSAGCPPHVLEAIYGRSANKAAQYDTSLKRW